MGEGNGMVLRASILRLKQMIALWKKDGRKKKAADQRDDVL